MIPDRSMIHKARRVNRNPKSSAPAAAQKKLHSRHKSQEAASQSNYALQYNLF